MVSRNIPLDIEKIINKKLIKFKNYKNQFSKIPPIIGLICAKKNGNIVFQLESTLKNKSFKSLKECLTENDSKPIELDLISMYLSSFKIFAEQTNIKNLSHLEIYGSNIKAQIYFYIQDFIIILFLNSNTKLYHPFKSQILEYVENVIKSNHLILENSNQDASREKIPEIEELGSFWIEELNKKYIKSYNKEYLNTYFNSKEIINELLPIIEKELVYYFDSIPEDTISNIMKEIKTKIQDKIYDLIMRRKI